MAVVTAAEVRAYLPTLTGTGDDTLLGTLAARFDQLAAGYLGFPNQNSGAISIESGTYVEVLDGPGGRELTVNARPVTSVTSVYDDPDLDYTDAADLIAADDYTIYGQEGRIVLDYDATDANWSEGRRHIKITYVAGYTGATMPNAVKHAACMQVAFWYNARVHVGKTKVQTAGQSAEMQTLMLLPEVKEALAPYRLASVWVG